MQFKLAYFPRLYIHSVYFFTNDWKDTQINIKPKRKHFLSQFNTKTVDQHAWLDMHHMVVCINSVPFDLTMLTIHMLTACH